MAVQTYRRPDLRPAVMKLLETAAHAIEDGGTLSLAQVVSAATGGTIKQTTLQRLEERGVVIFERDGDAAKFSNDAAVMSVDLGRFSLKIPARISGRAKLIEGGAELGFHPSETLAASKFFLSFHLERISVTGEQILIGAMGGRLGVCIELV